MQEIKKEELIGFFPLVKNSFDLYFDHFKKILFVMIIPFILNIIGFFSMEKIDSLNGQKGFGIWMALFSLLSIFVYIFRNLVPMGLFSFLENKGKSIGESTSYVLKNKMGSFIIAGIMYLLILIGGVFFIFIPTIYFSFSFFAFPFIVVLENEKGLKALFKSSEYVKGKWNNIATKIALLGMASFLFSTAFSWVLDIFHSESIKNIFSLVVLSFFIFPISLIFSYLLYKDLKRIKGDFTFEVSKKQKMISYTLIALSFLAVILYIILSKISLNML